MTVVGIFSCKSDLDKATVYLDFEGNDGDVFEVEIEDVAEVIELKQRGVLDSPLLCIPL